MKNYDWREQRVREAVANSFNYNEVLRALDIPTNGNNSSTLKRKIECFGIDISHFTFAPKSRGKKKNISEYLVPNSKCSKAVLKKRLLSEGYKANSCEVCGLTEWNGNPLVMQLHHKDGDTHNNCIENLMMICPNCHSQTINYRGNSNKTPESKKNYCQDCGREISRTSMRCLSCASKNRSSLKIDITLEEYESLKKNGMSNVAIAKKLGVTEAAIRKWYKKAVISTKDYTTL